MIKHILLWRFQDAVREDPAQAQEIIYKLNHSTLWDTYVEKLIKNIG